jgi:hypothetical protein
MMVCYPQNVYFLTGLIRSLLKHYAQDICSGQPTQHFTINVGKERLLRVKAVLASYA